MTHAERAAAAPGDDLLGRVEAALEAAVLAERAAGAQWIEGTDFDMSVTSCALADLFREDRGKADA